MILAAKGEDPGGLLPPHAGKNANEEIMATVHKHRPKRNLPMHPLVASWWLSEEANRFIGMENF